MTQEATVSAGARGRVHNDRDSQWHPGGARPGLRAAAGSGALHEQNMTFLPSYTDTGRTAGTLPRRGRRERPGRRAPCVPRGGSRAARPASSLSSGFQLGGRVSAAVRRPGPASRPSTPGASGAAAKTMFAFQKRSDWRLGEAPAERTARTQWASDGAGGPQTWCPLNLAFASHRLSKRIWGAACSQGPAQGPAASVVPLPVWCQLLATPGASLRAHSIGPHVPCSPPRPRPPRPLSWGLRSSPVKRCAPQCRLARVPATGVRAGLLTAQDGGDDRPPFSLLANVIACHHAAGRPAYF